MQLLLGSFLSVVISLAAYRLHSLDRSGAYAAVLVGTIVFGVGGWNWAVILLTFFLSSTALTRAFRQRKRKAGEKFAKGGQRDAGQVFGNGAVASVFVLANTFTSGTLWPWLGFAAAMAAVNADTWATELGVLASQPPRMLTDLRKEVERGTSGAVSLAGTLAASGGAALIGFLAATLSPGGINWTIGWMVTLAGLTGSFIDSYLGATVQAMYYCATCQKETERHPKHSCGSETIQVRGWAWLSNDWVNLACAGGGSLLVLGLHMVVNL